jgi:predicted Zn-dependent peptidase
MKKYCIILIIVFGQLFFAVCANANNIDIKRNQSGLTVIHTPSSSNLHTVSLYFRTGSLYEKDSTFGVNKLISTLIDNRIKENTVFSTLDYQIIQLPEQTGISLKVPTAELDPVLYILSSTFTGASFSSIEIDQAKKQILKKDDRLKSVSNEINRAKLLEKLWKNEFNKISASDINKSLANISELQLQDYYKRFYQLSYATLVVSGKVGMEDLLAKTNKTFRDNGFINFNPEQILHVIDLKPIINFSQILQETENDNNKKVGLYFQNPGTRIDRKGALAATIFAQIVTDLSPSLIFANYEMNNYYGIMHFSKDIQDNKFSSNIKDISHFLDTVLTLKYITATILAKAKDNILKRYAYIYNNEPMLIANQIAKFRFQNDEYFVTTFADSIQAISLKDLNKYITEYYLNKSGIYYAEGSKSNFEKLDSSERVYNIDESVEQLICTFDLNRAELEGRQNQQNIDKIYQWMVINKDSYLQINGFSDKGEYNKIKEIQINNFIDSVPDFKKVKPFVVKTKELRPEMVRALTVMKALYDKGLPIERMSGTCMSYSSTSKEESIANRKVTFTLEKRKPSFSTYEFHYGKKLNY